MKTAGTQTSKLSKQESKMPKPEIRDNLDSRKKGGPVKSSAKDKGKKSN